MWMEKLYGGVLRVMTPIGPRYIQPSVRQRILLMWIFRHFHTLPQQVLSTWQRRMIDSLCVEHRFISLPDTMADAPLIGTVEKRQPVTVEAPPHRASEAAMSPLADVRQRS